MYICIYMPDNIMESSTAVAMEMWSTSSSSNTGWNRLFQFETTTGNTNSINLGRSEGSGMLHIEGRFDSTTQGLGSQCHL